MKRRASKREVEIVNENEMKPKTSIKARISKYKILILVLIFFVIGVLVTNSINSSFTGAAVANARLECQEKISRIETLTAEKNTLELEKKNLQETVSKLNTDMGFLKSIITGLNSERSESLITPFGFKSTWDKYVSSEPNREITWFIEIENLNSIERTFSLDLNKKSDTNKVFEGDPSTGSLTLTSLSSGTLRVKMVPENKGYAIFGIYINGNYIGDLVIFSM